MREKKTARRVAFTAVFTALSTAFLYLAAVLPTGQLGFLGVSALCGIAAVVEYGIAGGVFIWTGTSILGFILSPSNVLAGVYAVFFGPYPVVKAFAEGRGRVAEWVIKLVFFNAALSVCVFALKTAMFTFSGKTLSVPVLYVAGNAVFAVFDVAVSRATGFYMSRIHPKIHK